MEHRIIDLHVHSTESDGTLTPTEIVSAAKAAGLSAFALTDHVLDIFVSAVGIVVECL